MSKGLKNPPRLEDHTNYENWEKALKLWRLGTDVPKAKQGIAVVLTLPGKAQEKVLELETEVINSETGLDQVLAELDKIYKKDSVDTAYEAFEKFICFRRQPSMNIREFINEFEQRYTKAKSHGFTLAASCLGYFLLNQAKLSDDHKKLVKATITKLDVEEVKTKLNKVFGGSETADGMEDLKVKIEDVNIAEEDVLYGNYGNRNQRSGNSRYPRGGVNNFQRRYPQQNQQSINPSTSGSIGYKNKSYKQREGRRLRCNICESINHLSYNCPDRKTYLMRRTLIQMKVMM